MGAKSKQDIPAEREAATIAMIRPEDRSPEPVVADVKPEDVPLWQSHGWVIKE